MAAMVNRVNEEIAEWQEKEKQLVRIFPEEVRNSRESLRNAANYYRSVLEKYRLSTDPDEQRSLLMLKVQVRDMENKLYPSAINKILRSVTELFSPRIKQDTLEVMSFRNESRLKDQMNRRGFAEIDADLGPHLLANKSEFSVPLSWTVNDDKKINFNLAFQRNHRGEYDFVRYTASLQQGEDHKTYVKQTFDVKDKITPTQAYNLLSGRAVEKEYFSPEGEFHQVWRKLDLNDRDQSGNYKMTTILHDKQFDVAGEVQTLVEQGLIVAPMTNTIIDGIRNGNDQYTLMKINDAEKVVYVRADAQNKMLKYSNEKHEPVTLMALLGKETNLSVVKNLEPEQTIENKQGLKI